MLPYATGERHGKQAVTSLGERDVLKLASPIRFSLGFFYG
jgi:hypothetical protein